MKTRPFLPLLALLLTGQLLAAGSAAAQVTVRVGGGYRAPRRAYYAPRYYAPPRPVVVYAVPPPRPAVVYAVPPPRPVVVVPAPYYAPRPYGYRVHSHHGRRW